MPSVRSDTQVAKAAHTTAGIERLVSGGSCSEERARLALPILVRQAEAGQPITYSGLAEELGMSNPRTLSYPLGCIGTALEELSRKRKEKIPPIQSLVINKRTGVPGEGISWFLRGFIHNFDELPLGKKKKIVAGAHASVFAYPHWDAVLQALSLQLTKPEFAKLIRQAGQASQQAGGGESERHQALKRFVANNPTRIGLPKTTPAGETEFLLPSGDRLDVSFGAGDTWIAAEVKTSISKIDDLVRGLYQCVKYRAVLGAVQSAEGHPRDARAILVLEGKLPPKLVPLRNILAVEVCEEFSTAPDSVRPRGARSRN